MQSLRFYSRSGFIISSLRFLISAAREPITELRPRHSSFVIRHLRITIRHSSFVILWMALALCTSCHKHTGQTIRVDPNGPVEVVMPEHGAYTGSFMDFGDEEDDVT